MLQNRDRFSFLIHGLIVYNLDKLWRFVLLYSVYTGFLAQYIQKFVNFITKVLISYQKYRYLLLSFPVLFSFVYFGRIRKTCVHIIQYLYSGIACIVLRLKFEIIQ